MKIGDQVRCKESDREGECLTTPQRDLVLIHWDTPVGLEADEAWLSELDLEVKP